MCIYVRIARTYVCVYAYVYLWIYVCVYVYVYLWIYVYMSLCKPSHCVTYQINYIYTVQHNIGLL